MVLGEIGEHRCRELTAGNTPLIQGVRTHFHGRHLRTGSHRFSQLRLQVIRKGRGVGGGDRAAWPAVHQGAEQRGRPPDPLTQMFDQMRHGGFAVGARDTHQGHAPRRVLPERSSQSTEPVGHRLWNNHHSIVGTGGISRCSGWSDHSRRCAVFQGLTPETASINTFPGKAQKQ